MKKLEEMSCEELKDIINARYVKASSNGVFSRLIEICRHFGTNGSFYYKGTYIIYNTESEHLAMWRGDKELLCTLKGRQFILQDKSIYDVIDKFYPKVLEIKRNVRLQKERQEKERLLAMI